MLTAGERRAELAFVLCAVLLALLFAQYRQDLTMPGTGWTAQVDFSHADKPFVLRVLVPALALLVMRGTGLDAPAVFWLAESSALVALTLVFRVWLRQVIPAPAPYRLLAFTLPLLLPWQLLLPRYNPIWFPYDLWAAVFLVAALLALRLQAWRWYYPLFVVATLNRETSICYTLLLVLTLYDRLPRRHLVLHVAAQAALWLCIRLLLQALFARNAGGLTEPAWPLFLLFLLFPGSLREALVRLAYLAGICAFLPVAAFGSYRRLTDVFVRRSLWLLPPFLAGMAVVGRYYEYRLFGEIMAIPLTAVLLLVVQACRDERAD